MQLADTIPPTVSFQTTMYFTSIKYFNEVILKGQTSQERMSYTLYIVVWTGNCPFFLGHNACERSILGCSSAVVDGFMCMLHSAEVGIIIYKMRTLKIIYNVYHCEMKRKTFCAIPVKSDTY